MIVKNNSNIIQSTLSILSKYIDYWIISDTGSTDNTIEIIKNYFNKVNIPGELFKDEWVDFGTNRTIALKYAYNKCDYIWIVDPNHILQGNLVFPENLNEDTYHIKFGKDFTYTRLQLFKSSLNWAYKCVLHEYPICLSKTNINSGVIEGEYYIDVINYEDTNTTDKYLKDAQILIEGLETDPENKNRYLFYIAQSYKDYGDFEKAIYWYKKRIVEKGWNEEVFISCLEIAMCLEKLNKSKEEIINAYIKASLIIEDRREALYYLAIYLKNLAINTNDNDNNKNKLFQESYNYLYKCMNIEFSKKYILFIHYDIYEWKNKFELATVLNLLNKKIESKKICNELLTDIKIRQDLNKVDIIENLVLKNINYNEEELIKYPKDIIDNILNNIKLKSNENINLTLTITTCKRYNLFVKTINSFINCCKDIILIDKYVCIDDNSSEEDRNNMKLNYPFFEFYFKNEQEKGHCISMNIIQDIVKSPFILHLEDDWLFIEKTYIIKPAMFILNSKKFNYIDNRAEKIMESSKSIEQVLFNKNYSENDTMVIHGGYMIQTTEIPQINFLLHEYHIDLDHPLKNVINCAYWPHYSFRPSIFKREIFDNLGKFDTNGFFEKKYAVKYYNYGYVSSFYDKIISVHIGRKTWEKDGINSYDLNNVNQHRNRKNI